MANNLNLFIKLNADGSALNSVIRDANGHLVKLGDAGKQAGASINKGMESARASSQALSNAMQSIKSSLLGIVSAAGLANFAKSFVDTADAVNSLNARIKLATKSTQEFTAAKARLPSWSELTTTSNNQRKNHV